MNDEFKRDILKIVIDKLLIGILLLVAGVLANNLVEKYKLDEGFKTELNKTRVSRIGEVWESLYIYEASVDNVVNEFTQIVIETEGDDKLEYERRQAELPPLIKVQKNVLAHLIATNHKNRFWIGEKTYTEINNYIDVLIEIITAYSEYDADKINKLNLKRNELRRGVTSIRDRLLGEQ